MSHPSPTRQPNKGLSLPLHQANRWPEITLVAYWLTLTIATHWPKLPGLDIPGKDKTAHLVAYALLAGLLLNVAARRFPKIGAGKIALAATIVASTAGALDERTQPWFNRVCDLHDWLADTAGAALVSLAYLAVTWMRRSR